MADGGYDTIREGVRSELEISRSRFLTRLERVVDEDAARAVIAHERAAHPRARHHCTAYILGPDGRLQRSSDDGEPSGTAGAPMLDALASAELSDVVAVVTRYFGGVLLGAAGLTRAYRAAVAGAVRDAARVRRALRQEVLVTSGYDIAPVLEAEARRRSWIVGDATYSDVVTQTYRVAERDVDALRALAAELSAGAARSELGTAAYADVVPIRE